MMRILHDAENEKTHREEGHVTTEAETGVTWGHRGLLEATRRGKRDLDQILLQSFREE